MSSSQTAFVDYKPSLTKTPTKPTPIAIRHPLQVEVEVLSGDNARHFLLPTVEIFDSATRVTTILLPLINPQPEPPAPVVTPPVK